MTEIKQNETATVLKSDEGELNLREYGQVIKRHRWSILTLTLMIAILATLVVYSMKPIYQSSAILLISPDKNNVVSIKEVYGLGGNDYFRTQYELLKSRKLVGQVVKKLQLTNNPEFVDRKKPLVDFDWRSWLPTWLPASLTAKPPANANMTFEKTVNQVTQRIQVIPINSSQLVKISFEANDRNLVAQIVNSLAQAYIENDMDAKLQLTTLASTWLDDRLKTLKNKLQESETALQQYREKQGLLESNDVGALDSRQLQELQTKLILTRQKRVEAETALRQVKRLKGGSIEKLSTLPAVLNDQLLGKLKQVEEVSQRNLQTLRKRYGPKHPKLIQAKADLKAAKIAVDRRVRVVLESIQKSYQVAKTSEQSLLSAINSAKNTIQSTSRKSYQLGVLMRDVASNKKLFELFLNRSKETKQTGLIKPGARIADPAVPALKPIKPKKGLIISIATILGLFFGIFVAFLHEHLDNTLRRTGDLEGRLQMTELGTLPHLKLKTNAGENPINYMQEHQQSYYSESIRTIRAGMLLSSLDNPYKVIMVTSSVPGEGKSSISGSLASSLAEFAKVLLIDADMRRPTVAKVWSIDSKAPGLSEYVSGIATISKCIHRIDDSNIHVMPSGIIPPNPVALLSSKRFGAMLETFSKVFDTIVIDTAPTLAVSDSLVVASKSSGVIYVVKSESTPIPAVREGLKRLRRIGANIIGGILNDIPHDQGKSDKGYYNYNYGYYGSYEGYHHD